MFKNIIGLLLLAPLFLYGQVNDKIWSITYQQANATTFNGQSFLNRYTSSSSQALTTNDVRVHSTTNTMQSEMSIAVSPLNKNIILASANATNYPLTSGGIYGTGVYWSTDGGTNWQGYDQPPTGNNKGDPATAVDRNGYFYVGGIASNSGQGIMRSTNNGSTWTYYQVADVSSGRYFLDKNHLAVDNSTSSQFVNNLYSAWTDFPDPYTFGPVRGSRSTNQGVNWTNEQAISGTGIGQGVNLQVGPGGTVYAVWAVPDISTRIEGALGFNKSTNGGVNWATPSTAISNIKGIRTSSFSTYGIRANSYPSMAVSQSTGHIYVVWTNYGVPGTNTGDADIYMIKSTNGGDSWGTPTRVNNDQIGNGANQFFPWITIDPVTDGISIVFFDGRSYISQKEVQVMLAYSTDGGTSFTNTAVNDVDFTVAPLPKFAGNYSGDYIGITSREGISYPLWHAQVPDANAQGWMTKIENSINITVDQTFSNGNRITGSQIGHYEANAFVNYTVPKTFTFNINANETMRADTILWTNSQTGNQEKYRTWNSDNNVVNHKTFTIQSSLNALTSQFEPSNNATVQSQLIDGGNPGSVQFSDPWLIDNTDAKGKLNRGTNAIFRTIDYASNNIGLGNQWFKGVFLNQTFASGTYYSVNAPSPTTINGFTSYFQNWSTTGGVTLQDASALQTGVVFTASGATATANYKGLHVSNQVDGYDNPSQSKVARSTYSSNFPKVLHLVYESGAKIWYETSLDNGVTWNLENDFKPLNRYAAKNPSIVTLIANYVLIVFEEDYEEIGSPGIKFIIYDAYQHYKIYDGYVKDKYGNDIIVSQYITQNIEPTVAVDLFSKKFIVIWKQEDTLGIPVGGLFSAHGTLFKNFDAVTWNGDYDAFTPIPIVGTNHYSFHPTLNAFASPAADSFALAWEQRTGTTSSHIYYKRMKWNSTAITFEPTQNISSASGYTYNENPSFITHPDLSSRVVWRGRRTGMQEELAKATAGTEQRVTVFKAPDYYRYWTFGQNIASPHINKSPDRYIIAWSENNGAVNKYTDNNLSTLYTLNTTGENHQVTNGETINNMYVVSYQTNSSPPYRFYTSNNIGGFNKAEQLSIANGREGVIAIGNTQFYFALGDITVNGAVVKFRIIEDTVSFTTFQKINEYLITEPFVLNNTSQFYYGIECGITDTTGIAETFLPGSEIRFNVELLDVATKSVIGAFDDVKFSATTLSPYSNIAYSVDTRASTNTTAQLRLTVQAPLQSVYSIKDKIADGSVLGFAKGSNRRTVVSYRGSLEVIDYVLSQNYPNPFNPSTTIHYELPNAGNVTPRVCDVLGREVKTLVDRYMDGGRYNVQFNVAHLASGLYFYRLTVQGGDGKVIFSQVKKMLVMK